MVLGVDMMQVVKVVKLKSEVKVVRDESVREETTMKNEMGQNPKP
jgi:hypothetical protein